MSDHTVTSVEELHRFSEAFLREAAIPALWILTGDLGVGKTTFVQGIAKHLGVPDEVTSPTFLVTAEYPVAGHSAVNHLVHVDLYRLVDGGAATDPAVRDVLERSQSPGRLTIIEWGERLGEATPEHARQLTFELGPSETARTIKVG